MPPGDATRIGEVLIEEGVVTQDELARSVAEAGLTGTALGSLLESIGHVRRADLAAFLAQNVRVPLLEDLRKVELQPSLAQLVPEDLARKHELIPVARLGGILCIAKSNYYNRAALQDLRNVVDIKIKVVQADEEQVRAAIEKLYKSRPGELPPPASSRPKSSTTVRRIGQLASPTPLPATAVAVAPPPAGDDLPLIEQPAAAEEVVPRSGRLSDVMDEVIEILDALKIPSQEFNTAARDPMTRMISDFDDVFQSGRAVAAPRL